MVSVSVDYESFLTSLSLSKTYDSIVPTVGIHPLYPEAFDQISKLRDLLINELSIRAVTETVWIIIMVNQKQNKNRLLFNN